MPDAVIRALTDLARPATIPQPIASPLRRFARGLEIPLFEEAKGQIVPLTRAAEKVLGVGFPGTAADAIEQLTGCVAGEPVERCLDEARSRGESSLTLTRGGDRWRMHATMAISGLQVAVVAQSTAGAGELEVLATVNHEMANGLTAMASVAARARRTGTSADDVAEALRQIEQAASDTLRSVHSTRRALRRRSTRSERPVAADLGPLLRDLVDSFAAVATRRHVQVVSDIEDQLVAAAPPGDLRSILWNLMKNAIEAVADEGSVRVEARPDGQRIRIVVEDDGPGMDAETRGRVFDPYFTTKREGSGLGLPLVKHLTQRLGGQLEMESEPGQGARFFVWLPRVSITGTMPNPRMPSAPPTVSGMRPAAMVAKRACLVGRAAEALEPLLREKLLELEPLATVLAEGAPLDWAFMDPDAASFASALRPHAGQIVWIGELPEDAEDSDALVEDTDSAALTRWLLSHAESLAIEEASGD